MDYTDLALELHPHSVSGLVQKGSLSAWLGQTLLEKIKGENRQPTAKEHQKLVLYQAESEKYIHRAASLGWKPETAESRDSYLKTIKEARENN
jgi:hypothetical protein